MRPWTPPVLGACLWCDLVVYRDQENVTGHVVLVIDPAKRVGWGTLGWDTEEGKRLDFEPGAHYQLLRTQGDWKRWDQPTMHSTACWRRRRFAREAMTPGGRSGLKAIAAACDPKQNCGR